MSDGNQFFLRLLFTLGIVLVVSLFILINRSSKERRNKMAEKIMTLDELTQVCGFFSSESSINNYYNCSHPDNEDPEYDELLKKNVGKCIHFYCPIAYNMEEEGFQGFSGDHRMGLLQSSEGRV